MSMSGDKIKDRIVSFLGVIVVLIAVVSMLPTLEAGVNNTGIPLLNYAFIGLLVTVGLVIFLITNVI